jgi:RND family efflux transporter MFP subunit
MSAPWCFRALVVCLTLPSAMVAAQASDVIEIDSVVLRPLVEAEIPARQTGVLAEILVTEGATVQEGDLLASLDSRVAQLAIEKAQLERAQAAAVLANELSIEYADKALEVARAELARSLESNEQFPNSISDSQLDVERLTVEKLQLERRQAEHELELQRFELQVKDNALAAAQLELDLHEVRAPFAGVVALVRERVGEWVEPGDAVLRLVAIDRLRAEGFAPAEVASDALVGTEVRFTLAPGDHNDHAEPVVVAGVVRFVSPEVDPVNGQVRLWAELDNADRILRPGQQGTLRIDPSAE